MSKNPYPLGTMVARAWTRGFNGDPRRVLFTAEEHRAWQEGQALKASYALTQGTVLLKHPVLKGPVR